MQSLEERFPEIPWLAFFLLHHDLPREGPGSDAATREAIRFLPELAADALVYDVGCGPGQQTLCLARELGTRIIAIDLVQPFLNSLSRRAAAAGLSHLIETRCADMAELDATPGSVDLIWSEGSIYFVGFERALRLWRPLLKSNGHVVASHATWLTSDPPEEARALFAAELPDMTDAAGNIRLANAAGYDVLHHFSLPATAWWDDYYTPLLDRIEELREPSRSDSDLAAVIAETEHEIDVFRRCQESYSYVFYVLRKSDTAPVQGT